MRLPRIVRVLDGEHRVAHGWGLLPMGLGLAVAAYLYHPTATRFDRFPADPAWRTPAIVLCLVIAFVGFFLLIAPPVRRLIVGATPTPKRPGTPEFDVSITPIQSVSSPHRQRILWIIEGTLTRLSEYHGSGLEDDDSRILEAHFPELIQNMTLWDQETLKRNAKYSALSDRLHREFVERNIVEPVFRQPLFGALLEFVTGRATTYELSATIYLGWRDVFSGEPYTSLGPADPAFVWAEAESHGVGRWEAKVRIEQMLWSARLWTEAQDIEGGLPLPMDLRESILSGLGRVLERDRFLVVASCPICGD